MKKFKVKNRPKRKYVKKSDLAQSYASTQSLTVGLVPLVLMAIAFFVTIFMTSSYTANLNLPTVRLSFPEISLPKTTLPEIKINAPELPKIILPKITISNPLPVIENSIGNFLTAFGASIEIASENIRMLVENVSSSTVRFSATIMNGAIYFIEKLFEVINSGITALGRAFSLFIQTIVTGMLAITESILHAMQYVYSGTVSAIQSFELMVQEVGIQFLKTIIILSKAALNAISNGFNAFMWFLGTPFRALHAYSVEIGNMLSPYGQFLAAALKHASDDLNQGGENLVNGTVYVSTTVENNSKND